MKSITNSQKAAGCKAGAATKAPNNTDLTKLTDDQLREILALAITRYLSDATNLVSGPAGVAKGKNPHKGATFDQSPPKSLAMGIGIDDRKSHPVASNQPERPRPACFGLWSHLAQNCPHCECVTDCYGQAKEKACRRACKSPEELAITEYAPDAADRMDLTDLTNDQRRELLAIVFYCSDGQPGLSECCTPKNAPWIFAVIDLFIKSIDHENLFIFDPETIYPFLLAQRFGVEHLHPARLRAALAARINDLNERNPDLFYAIQTATAAVIATPKAENNLTAIKSEAMRNGAYFLDDALGQLEDSALELSATRQNKS